jgi:DNA-binding NtrC family response regulator
MSDKAVIMFVDDEELIAGCAAKLFRRLGYQVQVFTNSRMALEAFHESPFLYDVLITDQIMPGLTGIALSEQILLIRPDLPVILCSGLDSDEVTSRAVEIGIRRVIMKPYDMNAMAHSIREYLPARLPTPVSASASCIKLRPETSVLTWQ